MSLSWAALYFAFLATPALFFLLGARVSPFYDRSYSKEDPVRYLTGFVFLTILLHFLTLWAWNACPPLPDIDYRVVLELVGRPLTPKDDIGEPIFLITYFLLANMLGAASGFLYKGCLLFTYKNRLFLPFTKPAHPLAYQVMTWTNVLVPDEAERFIICHVLTKTEPVIDGQKHRLLYLGILRDAEPRANGALGDLVLAFPKKLLLDPATGDITPAGSFDPSEPDSDILLHVPEANQENVLYEFAEIPQLSVEVFDEEPDEE